MATPTDKNRKPLGLFVNQPTPRFHDLIIEIFRVCPYCPRTQEAYVHWIRRYIT
jgi:hypothetical protein